MTVQQVAEALGCDESTIRRHIRDLFPDLPKNGKTTLLGEIEVTAIKKAIETSGRTDLGNVTQLQNVHTDLEMKIKAAEVIGWLTSEADRLRSELAKAAPKIESFEALQRSEQTMSITDAAKHFGLHPKTEVFPYLRDHGYLTVHDLPTQAAIDAGYLALRETQCPDGDFRKQSVVLASQLETWRTRVIPQAIKWASM
jgi:phage antirepressor YoqD-like protein